MLATRVTSWLPFHQYDGQIHTLTRSTPTRKQAGLLATVLVSYYDSLTEAARGYLRAFADDVDLAWALVLAVARHYNTVPEELRTVLSRHQLALQQIILNAPGTDEEHQVGEALSLIGNTWKRLNPIFRAEQLRRLSSHPNQTVAERARLLQQHGDFMAEHPGTSFWIMGDKIQVNGESEKTGDWGLRPGRVRRRR